MELVAAASFITAFIAGMAALFAPCCIGVLLPSYLASVFKTKTKIFLMTFVYYLGLLSIFLPLGMGIASLSSVFSRYHSLLFTLGGSFMLILGIFLLLGRSVMLPMKVHPKLQKYDFFSIYTLGVFSGIATTCCAPVLAGVLALSALPGSLWLGTAYALTFVTGMVVPLFVVAALADKTDVLNRFRGLKRQVNYSLLGHKISTNSSHLVSGAVFVIFGAFILVFERNNPDAMGSNLQLSINLLAARLTRFISNVFNFVPELVWALLFLGLFGAIAWTAFRQASKTKKED